jgi:hypothetical protein
MVFTAQMNAACHPLNGGWVEAVIAKSGDVVYPLTYAFPAESTATLSAQLVIVPQVKCCKSARFRATGRIQFKDERISPAAER